MDYIHESERLDGVSVQSQVVPCEIQGELCSLLSKENLWEYMAQKLIPRMQFFTENDRFGPSELALMMWIVEGREWEELAQLYEDSPIALLLQQWQNPLEPCTPEKSKECKSSTITVSTVSNSDHSSFR